MLGRLSICGGLALAGMLIAVQGYPAESDIKASADVAWREMEERGLLIGGEVSDWQSLTKRQIAQILEERALELRDRGITFFRRYPHDARRWKIVWLLIRHGPQFVTSYGPGFESNSRDKVIDVAAANAWRNERAELISMMGNARDIPTELEEEVVATGIQDELSVALSQQVSAAVPVDWKSFAQRISALAERHPDGRWAATLARYLMPRYEKADFDAALTQWNSFAHSRNVDLAEFASRTAGQKSVFRELSSQPLDFDFTALDGSKVRLKELRGRIVLIDFWATWCAPCMAEMPYIRRAYELFHGRGLEVIGVSCDVAPGDGDLHVPKAKSAGEVLAFARAHGMEWPQFYDGKRHGVAHGNAFAAKFAVTGIPALFLLDRDGRLLASDIHGRELIAVVERALSGKRDQ